MTGPVKHSPEPWKVTRQNGACMYVGTAAGRTIAIFGGYGAAQSQKDARRALDLVNALAGIGISEIRKWARLQRRKNSKKAVSEKCIEA